MIHKGKTPHDDKIVMWGMSCVGKTTFAKSLRNHDYYCFDALFDWYSIETLGLSTTMSLKGAMEIVSRSSRYVLDGWNLGDKYGLLLPGITIYVVYAAYEYIINQYRVKVEHFNDYRFMFKKWYYEVPYGKFSQGVRYWENQGDFIERSNKEFQAFLECNR